MKRATGLLLLLGMLAWFLWPRRVAVPELSPSTNSTALFSASSSPPSRPAAWTPPVRTNSAPLIGERLLADYLAPHATVQEDLTWMSRLLDNARTLIKGDNPLPLGTNEEIAASLLGKNRIREPFLRASHRAFNARGQIIDRWGTPLFFHALSADRIAIRSAGPDRELGTDDDIERQPDGRFVSGKRR